MFKPTKQQKDAIITRGSVLVTAAAGSGKTAVLVERVVEMLCNKENPSSVDRLVIVTFTKAAAAEMRMRIEKRIIEKLKENPNDRHLSRQLMILPSARICTIDTFCIDLVRENFDTFSLSPDFKIGDAASLTPLYTEAADAVLEKYYATRQNEIEALLRALHCTWGDSKLTEAIVSVFEYSRNLPFPEQWLSLCRERYKNLDDEFFSQCRELSLEEPYAALLSAREQLKNALSVIDQNEKLAASYKEKLADAYSLAERICESDRDTALSLCKTAAMPVIYGHSGDETAAVRRARSAFLTATKNFAAAMDTDDSTAKENLRAAAPFAVTLLEMTEDFANILFSLMREKNTLTFYNTEQMALQLLCDVSDGEYRMSEKAKELCDGIDEILVDEYQDTNDLQDTLFYLLSGYGKKLFAVGDVKQSIYGFRGANPENFVKKKEEYIPLADASADDGKKIVLSSNFRSRKGICDFVNCFCSLIMSKELGGVEYDEEEVLNSASAFQSSGFTDTEVHIISSADSDETVELAEAKHIAAYIKNNVGKDAFLKDGESLRPAWYSDFAILLRSPGAHSEVYMEELKKAGIPARFDVGGFITSVEVSAVLSLLKTINNPTHDVPLLACMMSPVFAFSADDIAEIRLCDRGVSLYGSVVAAAGEGNEKAKKLLERLRQYRRAAVTMSPERLVAYLYEETGLLDSVCAMDDGERRRKNLLLFLDYAKSYGDDGGDSRGFATYIEKIGASVKTPAGNSGGDAVNIVSFHGSKGLQYPVCIVAGCFRRFNDSDLKKNLLIDRTLGVAFRVADDANNRYINNVAREAIARTVKKRNLSEELRVMYVALTRAQERLVVLLSAADPAKRAAGIAEKINSGNGNEALFETSGYFDWFLYVLLKLREQQPLRDALGAKIGEEYLCDSECKIKTLLSAAETVENAKVSTSETTQGTIDSEEIIRRFEYVYPFEALTDVKSKLSVSEIAHKRLAENNFTAQPAFLSKAGLTPAQRGTATHKFMQFADYFAAAEDLESEKKRLVDNGFMTNAEAVAVNTDELAKFFSCELFLRMSQCSELHREMRFLSEFSAKELYGTDIGNGEKTVVQGVIDCVIEEEDSVTVLDFKTDRVKNGEQLKELYAAQLEIYAAACERIFSKPVKEKLLYSFCLGSVIKV